MTIRKPRPAKAVVMIRTAFNAAMQTGAPLTAKDAYQLLAELEGYKNWAHAKKNLESAQASKKKTLKLGCTKEEVQDWPTFVIFSQFDDDTGEEVLWVMPPGSTLRNRALPRGNWGAFNEDGSVTLPDDLFSHIQVDSAVNDARMSSFVVKEVFAVIPRPERYGVPHYANELGVRDWVVGDLGWNYLAYDDGARENASAIDVNFADSGDDGAGRYWMEVAVAPTLAPALLKAFGTVTGEPSAAA